MADESASDVDGSKSSVSVLIDGQIASARFWQGEWLVLALFEVVLLVGLIVWIGARWTLISYLALAVVLISGLDLSARERRAEFILRYFTSQLTNRPERFGRRPWDWY